MAFGDYKSLGDVALAHQISAKVAPFVEPVPFPVDERVRAELSRTS